LPVFDSSIETVSSKHFSLVYAAFVYAALIDVALIDVALIDVALAVKLKAYSNDTSSPLEVEFIARVAVRSARSNL